MTLKNKILPALAVIGLVVAIVVAVRSQKKNPPAEPVAQPAQAPYASYIGGAGIVEASTENIQLGTSIAGIVKTVFVKVGDTVRQGDKLFLIDDRELEANLLVKEASLVQAEGALEEAKASLQDYETRFKLVQNVTDRRALSVDDFEQRKNAVLLYKAKLVSAKAEILAAQAALQAARTDLDRLLVRAPVDCMVLQVNIRPGEYAQTGVLDDPLMLLGDNNLLHIRIDIDENDAWRFKPGSQAMAFMRGNSKLNCAIKFVRTEPYITPKESLTGDSTERIDTRVLQVIYGFDRNALPAYVGQQMDVFIETPEEGISHGRGKVEALAAVNGEKP
ncbi:efflux RND transporter periplasmic adaptor subunit [Desulfobulbus sp.]|uniref:efflux RND transporter periplasmic adaptor subunit n=1 Tax=Desulfobulbus sp. TaxID=895 RepID=UPI0027BAA25D|nr:biotin/lipoyl-binding protein [Desulfobulbus sp.]